MNRFPNSQRLIDLITHPLTFAEYMDLVLYHPEYGYYGSGQAEMGTQGDYFTSSSLGSTFGELLATQLWEIWQKLGKPNPFLVVEMGAGNGQLCRDIFVFLQENYPLILKNLDYIIIERSPVLIHRQKENLTQFKDQNISWQTWDDIPDNSVVGCFFSNELVDAFPVHRLLKENQQLKEIYVMVADGQIKEVIQGLSTSQLENYFNLIEINLLSEQYPQGYKTEVNLTALTWLTQLYNKLKRGYIITIDYGYPALKYYHPQRYEGTLNCYYQHRFHSNPYQNLGYQDMTTHIDFAALEKQGQLLGLETIGLTKQGLFLMALGLGQKLTELSAGNYNLSEIMQRRDALHQLINPNGLGGFWVLIQGKGLSSAEKQQKLRGLYHGDFGL